MGGEIEVTTTIHAAADVVFELELDADVHADSVAGSGETAATSTGRRSWVSVTRSPSAAGTSG